MTLAGAGALEFDWLGLLGTVAGMVVTFAVSWGVFKAQQATQDKRLDKLEAAQDAQRKADEECARGRGEIATTAARLEGRVERVERDVVDARAKADSVSDKLAALVHLPDQVKELDRKLDRLLEMGHPRAKEDRA